MSGCRWLVGVMSVLTAVSSPAGAETRAEPGPAEIRAVPPALDPAFRHRKRHQLEVGGYIGTYLGAHLKRSWITGARAMFHLGNLFSLGAAYGYSRHAVNMLDGPDDLLTRRHTHYLTGEVGLSTDVAMRMGKTVILMDLSTRIGAGARQLDGDWGALFLIGGGVKFYTGLPWLAVRIDVNNYMHWVRLAPGRGSSFDVDVSFALGFCFFIPWRRSPFEQR